jgi:hypothetical protein
MAPTILMRMHAGTKSPNCRTVSLLEGVDGFIQHLVFLESLCSLKISRRDAQHILSKFQKQVPAQSNITLPLFTVIQVPDQQGGDFG